MKKAYQRVAEMTRFDMVKVIAENEDLKDANRQLAADNKKLEERECSVQAKELGKQAVRYRKSVVHLLRYINNGSNFPYRVIKNPELDLLKDIEDFAAEGRLHDWNDTADRGLRIWTSQCRLSMPTEIFGTLMGYLDSYEPPRKTYDSLTGLPVSVPKPEERKTFSQAPA
jgi:hypothetical protein